MVKFSDSKQAGEFLRNTPGVREAVETVLAKLSDDLARDLAGVHPKEVDRLQEAAYRLKAVAGVQEVFSSLFDFKPKKS